MSKTWLFRAIAICIPLLFFVGLEFGLRAIGYGKTVPLFMPNPAAPHYLLPTPDVVKRYFSNESIAPNVTIEPNFFLKDKPKNGLRIAVQGGSTAAGFPYGLGASIAGMLDYRLKQTFPERPVEVINTALAAVNSYTLLDFADEIIAQQPDVVLIYAGHNEYLGILGAGSAYTAANSRGATLMYLKLKDLRTFQLLQNVYGWFVTPEVRKETGKSRTMMAKVAKHKNIEQQSSLFAQGLAQFEGNMELLLAKYKAANIPVMIATIESNLRDQAPFSSKPVSADQTPLLQKEVGTLSNQEMKQLEQAATDIADIHFRLGQERLYREEIQAAKTAFENAKQHDLLRFRAPKELNEIIRRLADDGNVYLVDAQAALAASAKNGIVGADLMLEHLHPTVKGYFVIADSFYQTLQDSKLIGSFPYPVNRFSAQRDIPMFEAEHYWGAAKIAALMADYPFVAEPTDVKLPVRNSWHDELGYAAYQKKIGWLDIAQQTQRYAMTNKDVLTFLKAAKLIADALPNDQQKNFDAGLVLLQNKRALESLRYFDRVLLESPKNTNAMLAKAHAYSEIKKYEQSLSLLEQVVKLDPDNKTALENLPKLREFLKK